MRRRAILELRRIETGLLLRDDLLGDLEHLAIGFGQVLTEHRAGVADLVVAAQGRQQDAAVARLECAQVTSDSLR